MAVMTTVLVTVAMTLVITFIAQRTMKALLICVGYQGTPVGRDRKASVVFTTQALIETNWSIIANLKWDDLMMHINKSKYDVSNKQGQYEIEA